MIRKSLISIFIIVVLITSGCVKETYDMSKLSAKAHLSPTFAISAVKGGVSFSDLVKESDTVVYDENKFVKLIFKEDSVIDLTITDFGPLKKAGYVADNELFTQGSSLLSGSFDKGKGTLLTATIEPQTLDLGIDEMLGKISGDIFISNPSVRLIYTNSIEIPTEVTFNAYGKRKDKTENLDLAPFFLNYPVSPVQSVSSTLLIDKTNSSLDSLISLPPEVIIFSGTATMSVEGDYLNANILPGNNRIVGSVEVEVPLELRLNNLQFTDTVDNFMDDTDSESAIKPENFEFLRVNIYAENGFPLGVTLKMTLYDSANEKEWSTVDARDLIKAAPVDASGKSNGTTETNTTIEFTETFFGNVNKSDKIIFRFGLNSSENGSKDVKIYSDYRIDFKAALVVKPDIQF